MPSLIYAQILLVEIAQRGSFRLILPSLPIGKKFVFKRIHLKSPRDQCLGL